jgi:hypothetical protein
MSVRKIGYGDGGVEATPSSTSAARQQTNLGSGGGGRDSIGFLHGWTRVAAEVGSERERSAYGIQIEASYVANVDVRNSTVPTKPIDRSDGDTQGVGERALVDQGDRRCCRARLRPSRQSFGRALSSGRLDELEECGEGIVVRVTIRHRMTPADVVLLRPLVSGSPHGLRATGR